MATTKTRGGDGVTGPMAVFFLKSLVLRAAQNARQVAGDSV